MTTQDVTTVLQDNVSGFTYTSDDLAALPKSLFIFGKNIIESLTKSKGGLNAIYAKDPVTNQAVIIGTYRSAPELGEMPFRERVHRVAANYMERVFDGDCAQVFLIKLDACGRPDDLNVWDSVFLVEGMRLNDISIEALQSFDDSPPVEMTGTFNLIQWSRILPIRFTEEAADTVLAEILDIIYADKRSCGACGSYSNGCEGIFALAKANSGSPGLSSQLVYRVRDGGAWTAEDIDPLGGVSGSAIAAVGRYLVVISEAGGKHVYATKPSKAGQAITWTAVSSGYEAGGSPRAIFAKSAAEVFIAGAGGYLYKSEDITASVEVVHDASLTTQNFNSVHGSGQVIVAVGDNDTILYSINNGESFSTPDDIPEAGVNLLSVWCVTQSQWYVGTASGKLWYTDDQGATWTQRALPDQSSITAVYDLKFSPDSAEVGAVAVQKTNTGHVYRTITGGRTWYSDSPGIDGLAPNERINKVALCGVNQVAAGGKDTGSTDGLIAVAK